MTFEPHDQDLSRPIQNMVDAMEFFSMVADNRVKSGEWSKKHDKKLIGFQKTFIDLKYDLNELI